MSKLILERVKKLLESNPQLRDDDRMLTLCIWFQDIECNDKIRKELKDSITDTLLVYAIKDPDGEYILTNTESIRRSRQSIQQHCPELRGELNRKEEEPVWEEELQEAPEHLKQLQMDI